MKKIALEMPAVSVCTLEDCCYNRNGACFARAITIGDGKTPHCDTFLSNGNHVRKGGVGAGVGACKVISCRHNDDYECTADEIVVRLERGHALCRTFEERAKVAAPE